MNDKKSKRTLHPDPLANIVDGEKASILGHPENAGDILKPEEPKKVKVKHVKNENLKPISESEEELVRGEVHVYVNNYEGTPDYSPDFASLNDAGNILYMSYFDTKNKSGDPEKLERQVLIRLSNKDRVTIVTDYKKRKGDNK